MVPTLVLAWLLGMCDTSQLCPEPEDAMQRCYAMMPQLLCVRYVWLDLADQARH